MKKLHLGNIGMIVCFMYVRQVTLGQMERLRTKKDIKQQNGNSLVF